MNGLSYQMRDRQSSFQVAYSILAVCTVLFLLFTAMDKAWSGGYDTTDHRDPIPASVVRIDDHQYILRSETVDLYSVCRDAGQNPAVESTHTLPDFDNARYVKCSYAQHWGVVKAPAPGYGEALLRTLREAFFWAIVGGCWFALTAFAVPMYLRPVHRHNRRERALRRERDAQAKIQAKADAEAAQLAEIERLQAEIDRMRSL